MSTADQPLLIATMGYHVGHTVSIRVGQEQGYFREEGLAEFDFDGYGLLPRRFEREALALSMEERGVDIALGAGAAFHQRSIGADLFIVGGWRLDGPAGTRWYGREQTALARLRGAKAGIRERGSMNGEFLARELVHIGIDLQDAVTWVYDPIFYGDNPKALDALSSGRVDLIPLRPGAWEEADRRGFSVLLDSVTAYPGGRPAKVVVATGATLRERPQQLAAFLRANIRAFWFVRDPANFAYIQDLDARSRDRSHNVDERRSGRLVTVVADCETWPMPLDGGVARNGLERIMQEQVASSALERPLPLGDILRDEIVREAYAELCARPESQAALERNRGLIHKYGF
jgi:ABC-type nitrate/sulfonate/bicarbonate transport system substrate-binding protein